MGFYAFAKTVSMEIMSIDGGSCLVDTRFLQGKMKMNNAPNNASFKQLSIYNISSDFCKVLGVVLCSVGQIEIPYFE